MKIIQIKIKFNYLKFGVKTNFEKFDHVNGHGHFSKKRSRSRLRSNFTKPTNQNSILFHNK